MISVIFNCLEILNTRINRTSKVLHLTFSGSLDLYSGSLRKMENTVLELQAPSLFLLDFAWRLHKAREQISRDAGRKDRDLQIPTDVGTQHSRIRLLCKKQKTLMGFCHFYLFNYLNNFLAHKYIVKFIYSKLVISIQFVNRI